jgi:hypothetical protein
VGEATIAVCLPVPAVIEVPASGVYLPATSPLATASQLAEVIGIDRLAGRFADAVDVVLAVCIKTSSRGYECLKRNSLSPAPYLVITLWLVTPSACWPFTSASVVLSVERAAAKAGGYSAR